MTTGLTNRLLDIYTRTYKPRYIETFDEFCESMLLTKFLKEEEKFIISKLLKQWGMNGK